MNHLLNTFEWEDSLWNCMETILKRKDRVRNSIQETIQNWRGNFSNTQLVNTIWKLILGFIAWKILKEINRQVFLNETRGINYTKDTILQNIKKTFLSKGRMEQEKNISISDLQILKDFDINTRAFTSSINHRNEINTDVNTQIPLSTSFLKLNFDGASGGNLGPVGIGGVLRDNKGEIQHIYSQSLGEGTYNKMEFAVLEQGLRILRRIKARATMIEGDSQLAIMEARRMYTGAKPSKVTRHWRLAQVKKLIEEHLSCLDGLILHVVR